MAKTRRAYTGAPAATTITGALTATSTSIGITSNTGWYGSSDKPFYVVVSPGLAAEEKVLVTISGTTLSVVNGTSGRGQDGTTASAHDNGAVIYPVPTAIDFDEANELTSKYANQGSIVYQGASTFTERTIGTAGQVLKVNSGATAPEWGQVPTAGIADAAVTSAKLDSLVAGNGLAGGAGSALSVNVDDSTIEINSDALRLKDGGVTSAKIADGTIVNGDISGSAAIALSKLATGALPTAITVASANIVDGTIVNADINASAAIALSKLATGALPTAITVASANIVDGTIVDADINTSAAIAPTKVDTYTISRSRTTDTSISNNSWTDVLFGSADWNYGGIYTYDSGTGEIEIPAGVHMINASLRFTANGTGTRGIRIIGGGGIILAQSSCAAAPAGATVVNCMNVSRITLTSKWKVQAYQTSGGSLDVEGSAGTDFQITLMGSYS